MNKAVALFIFSVLFIIPVRAQVIDNELDISLGAGIGKFGGTSIVYDDGFITPSLYFNYKNLYGVSLKGILIKKRYFDLGTAVNFARASGWRTGSYTDYENSVASLFSLNPMIRLHNKVKDYGMLNRIMLFLGTGPVAGISKLSMSKSLFDIRENSNPVQAPVENSCYYLGLKGSAGLEVSISQTFGVFFEYSYSYNLVASKFYADDHFSNQNLEAGLILKLIKNKRFLY